MAGAQDGASARGGAQDGASARGSALRRRKLGIAVHGSSSSLCPRCALGVGQ
eukprot:gene12305-biopygen6008